MIEQITGKELPRGEGTQTRVPCQFKMRKGPLSMNASYLDANTNERITQKITEENMALELNEI